MPRPFVTTVYMFLVVLFLILSQVLIMAVEYVDFCFTQGAIC